MNAVPSSDHADGEDDLGTIYVRYLPLLTKHFRVLGCGDDAGDLAAGVFANFVKYRKRYPDTVIGNVRAYLMGIARNLYADYVEGRQSDRDWRVPLRQLHDGEDSDADEWISARAKGIRVGSDFDAVGNELVAAILDGVGDVLETMDNPKQCLDIVRLAIEGHSYKEIAAKVGVPVDCVRNVMNRMRKKLAKLHPEWAEGRRLRGPQRGTPRTGEGDGDDDPPEEPGSG